MKNTTSGMKYQRLTNWFGTDTAVRELVAKQLEGRALVVIPFAGSMSVLPLLTAKKIIVSDVHRHLINLAQVIKHPTEGAALYRRLRRELFHPAVLAVAQERCRQRDELADEPDELFAQTGQAPQFDAGDRVAWAADYFICSWMGRGAGSGVKSEFNQSLPVRYSPNGGGSAQRFHGAVESVPAWKRVLRKCEVTLDDAFEVLSNTHDTDDVGIYVDAPWPDDGDTYVHTFTEQQQRDLAWVLGEFKSARVVVRYGDHPLIRELYPEEDWTWHLQESRTQANKKKREVVMVKKGTS